MCAKIFLIVSLLSSLKTVLNPLTTTEFHIMAPKKSPTKGQRYRSADHQMKLRKKETSSVAFTEDQKKLHAKSAIASGNISAYCITENLSRNRVKEWVLKYKQLETRGIDTFYGGRGRPKLVDSAGIINLISAVNSARGGPAQNCIRDSQIEEILIAAMVETKERRGIALTHI